LHKTIIVISCFVCLVDIEILGLRVSQIGLLILCPIYLLLAGHLSGQLFRDKSLIPFTLYLFFIAVTPFIYNVSFNLMWFGLNAFNLIFMLCFLTYLRKLSVLEIVAAIKLFMFMVGSLILFDIVWMFFGLDSLFLIFSTNPLEGYKNHQLFSNEPNWLSILFLFLAAIVTAIERRPSRAFLVNTTFCLLVLNSRIVLLLYLIMLATEGRSLVSAKSLIRLSGFLFLSVTSVIYFTDVSEVFYDLLDIRRNPRLNDFVFYTNEAFQGGLSWWGSGAGALLQFQAPWRDSPQIVVNSLATQLYVEAGLIGSVLFFVNVFFFLPKEVKYFTFFTIVLVILHNFIFRQQFWLVLALATTVSHYLRAPLSRGRRFASVGKYA